MSRIYLSVPHMGGDEEGLVREAFATNWLSSVGPHVDAFEREFGVAIGSAQTPTPSCALASGTAAIHLGLRLLGVQPGDVVIAPTLTFVASVNPARYLGAELVFVDSERTSWNMDPNLLEDAIRALARRGIKPRAIIVVHLYGQSAQMEEILAIARAAEIPVLEDAAEALGTLYRGVQVGAMGDVGAFSFNGNKIITTTSGGMLCSNNPTWVDRAKFWSTQARDPGIAYEHSEVGYNYRMSNVLAGIGRGQLRVLASRVEARRRVAFKYRDAFQSLEGLELMPQAPYGLHTNWLSAFTVAPSLGATRDELIEALARQDIEARPVWKPMHIQPLFKDAETYGGAVAEDVFTRGLCLPSSSSLSEEDQARVVSTITERVRRAATRSGTRPSAAAERLGLEEKTS